ncbi:putative E3 ubiquitin-protein ligase SINA-like 6 [Orchesella cincta]|uniref:RING-type E3 ubiquitin transferase n=1 Tax=Orchesella cincta TaxID=48709 RepID=A0A1D2MBE3_ORCCI|nr:putative E3 ubiquitin-protein ligase SINA-like 6 [Orchesella cincta]
MEKFRSCPICLEVPEGDIFQCTAGHMICSSCIPKVDGDRCPQCRIPFGNPKIRSRILEEILDAQEFQCRFSDQGCNHLCKRSEVTRHGNSCSFNPDTVSLCKQFGFSSCEFQLGCISRAEIISHFEGSHNLRCSCKQFPSVPSAGYNLRYPMVQLRELLSRKRRTPEDLKIANVIINLMSSGTLEDSPLFLFITKMNWAALTVSFAIIKLWESSSTPPTNYNAKFTLLRGNSTEGQLLQPRSNSTSETVNPYPLTWEMKVFNIKEAQQVLNWIPMSIPVSMLKETQFGSASGDVYILPFKLCAWVSTLSIVIVGNCRE